MIGKLNVENQPKTMLFNMKNLKLNEDQLNELVAKVANELEDYGSQATPVLKEVFVKLVKLKPTRETLLVQKFKKKLIK